MESIFTYSDYRAFLRDHYAEKKKQSKSYSFRYFARKAGLQSPNYYKLVMDGRRNLTHRNVRKFSHGLGLGEREQVYFENLVFYNQTGNDSEKEFLKKNLEIVKAKDDRELLTHDQYEAFSSWPPFAIKELLLCAGEAQWTPKKIAARFDYRFTPQQAREALGLLERLKLIETDGATGTIRVTQQSLQTPDLARSDALAKFHKTMVGMVQDAVDSQSSDERCLSSLTVAVRKQDLPEVFEKIHRFRDELDTFFGKKKPYDSVYQLNIQLFRLDCDAA